MRLLITLIIFTVISTYIPTRSCEDGDDVDEKNDENSDEQRPSIEHIEGESRGYGGYLAGNVPKYIGHVFGGKDDGRWPFTGTIDRTHGRLGGFTVHLDEDHAIMHQSSLDKLSQYSTQNHLHDQPHLNVPVRSMVSSQDHEHYGRAGAHETLNRGMGGSPFNLVKFGLPRTYTHNERPKLETSKNEFGSNCNLYTYGEGAKAGGGSRRSTITADDVRENPLMLPTPNDDPGPNKEMIKIPVKMVGDKCNSGLCKMRTDTKIDFGQICNHYHDAGAPIICGKEQKVTYLTDVGNNGKCSPHFNAYHVPHLVDHIQKHVPINQ